MSAPAAADPLDRVGADTLEVMSAAPRYNAWQYRRIAPFLGRRVCEIGSGIGNMSALLAARPLERLVLTDTDPYYRDVLRDRFRAHSEVTVEALTLPDPEAAARFRHYALDTVVALNVIEHIPEDVAALRCVAGMLAPGGRAVVLVPALPALYGSLDRELQHARRYRRAELRAAFGSAGLRVTDLFYFNVVGTAGLVLERARPPGQAAAAPPGAVVRRAGAAAPAGGRGAAAVRPVAGGRRGARWLSGSWCRC